MNALELRKELISRISSIEDIDLLNAINTILDNCRKEPFIELTHEQEQDLLFESEEAKKGNIVSQEEIDEKIYKWTKK